MTNVIQLSRWSDSQPIIAEASEPTDPPTENSTTYIGRTAEVVTFISGTGSGTLMIWLEDGGQWYQGDTYDFDGTPEAVYWYLPNRRFTFQVTEISGGNVTVKVK